MREGFALCCVLSVEAGPVQQQQQQQRTPQLVWREERLLPAGSSTSAAAAAAAAAAGLLLPGLGGCRRCRVRWRGGVEVAEDGTSQAECMLFAFCQVIGHSCRRK